MKKLDFKHLFGILLSFVLMLTCLLILPTEAKAATISRSGNCGGSATYTLDSDGVLTISGSGAIWEEPSWLDKEWGEDEVYKVVIGSGITSIPDYCFAYCGVMTSITLPGTITSIGKSAFNYCSSLTSISIPSGVTNIGTYTFSNCSALTSVSLPTSLTSIGNYAFYKSGITSITIPASVTEIGSYVFFGCASLTKITVNTSNANYSSDTYGVLFNKAKTELLAAPGAMKSYTVPSTVTKIGVSAFANSTGLTSISIPGNVKEIGNTAFENCTNLTTATLSAGVTTIGYRAFNGCTSLSNLTVPDGLTSVGVDAFYNTAYYNSQPDGLIYFGTLLYGCKGTVPASVTVKSETKVIADSAFYYNSTLTTLSLPEGLERIGTAAFSCCSGLQSVTIPSTVTDIGERAFSQCGKMTSAWVKSGVTTIGKEMFYRCTKLADLSLPDSITHIGEFAFSYAGLTEFHVPAGLKTVGKDAFYYVSDTLSVYINDLAHWFRIDFASETAKPLMRYSTFYVNGQSVTDITVPTSVTKINNYAFAGWENLTSIKLHNAVTAIGDFAFYGYSKMTTITLPSSLKSIGKYAFEFSRLTSVTIPDSVTEIGEWAFADCSDLEYIKLPSGLKTIPEYMIIWSRNLRSVIIPEGVTTISKQAFYGAGIQWIQIPSSVTTIGDSAFYYADSLTHVFYTGTETQWNAIQRGQTVNLPTTPHHYRSADSLLTESASCSAELTCCSECRTPIEVQSKDTASHNFVSGVCTACGTDEDWTYAFIGAGIMITGYTGSATILEIPETIEGLPVTIIADKAFKNNSKLISVTVPSNVKTIYGDAFYYCTGLKHLILPESLTSISSYAFYSCSKLAQVCYTGSSAQASAMTIGTSNTYLKNATWTYNAQDPQIQTIDSCVNVKYQCSCCSKTLQTVTKVTPTHNFADATCTTPKTCTVCLATEGEALGHSGDVWIEILSATCTEEGISARICDVCSETETASIPANGHSYNAAVTTPTCTQQGYTTNTCSACGDVKITDYVDANGHSFGDWMELVAPGCTEEGMNARMCSCGETETQSVAALGHSYESAVTAPTCTEQGYTTNTCSICGDVTVSNYVDAKGHSFGDWVQIIAPDCTAEGKEERTCACGETETQSVAALGHSFGDWVQLADPDCTTEGMQARTCACGETETQSVAALGHSYDSVVTAPTCTQQGYTTNTCSVCGNVSVTDYVDAKGHSWSAWIQTKAPTCTTEGTQVRFCNCGTKETAAIEKAAHTCENGICTVCGALESYSWVLTADANVDLTLEQDLYVDLNGYDLSGTVNTNGYQIYGTDATTDDYTCESMGYFSCVDASGNAVIPVKTHQTEDLKRYMTVETESGYTFHRFYMGITNINLAPGVTGLGYKAELCGDEMVQSQIAAVGYELWLKPEHVVSRSKSGFQSSLTLRLTNMDVEKYGETPINACVTVTLLDGTILKGATHSNSMRNVVEKLNTGYAKLNENQLSLVQTMINNNPAMQDWSVENLVPDIYVNLNDGEWLIYWEKEDVLNNLNISFSQDACIDYQFYLFDPIEKVAEEANETVDAIRQNALAGQYARYEIIDGEEYIGEPCIIMASLSYAEEADLLTIVIAWDLDGGTETAVFQRTGSAEYTVISENSFFPVGSKLTSNQ